MFDVDPSKIKEDVCVLALFIQNEKILVGWRHYKENDLWVLPGGRGKEGESLQETLYREVEEETGITDMDIVSPVGSLSGVNEGDKAFIFYCKSEDDPELKEPDKFSKWKWAAPDNIREQFISDKSLAMIENYLSQKE